MKEEPKQKIMDVMLDLETLGTGTSPVIIQLAAVAFDMTTGETHKEIDMKISARSCIEYGMNVSGPTIEWWLKQDPQVVNDVLLQSLHEDSNHLIPTLNEFKNFLELIRQEGYVIRVWGNGIMADNRWLESAYAMVGMDSPINHWEHNDVRTLVDIGQRLLHINPKDELSFAGKAHNAIDDCKHQIKYCHAIYKAIGILAI